MYEKNNSRDVFPAHLEIRMAQSNKSRLLSERN